MSRGELRCALSIWIYLDNIQRLLHRPPLLFRFHHHPHHHPNHTVALTYWVRAAWASVTAQ